MEFDPSRYRPTSRQLEFLKAAAPFVCYGGARGGGKSWALDFKCCCLAKAYPGIQILILRQTQKDVKQNHLAPLRAMIRNSARWNEADLHFTWKNGSGIRFGYCDADADLDHLQGQSYQIVCVDEATQLTESQFAVLCAICRGGRTEWPRRVYLTCNPGGVGHAWVKRLFVDRVYARAENPEDYVFIQSFVWDNPHNGPEYRHMLELLPENLRSGWLNGRWDAVSGQFFSEWRQEIHVVPPRQLPGGARRYFTMDYGLDMLAAYWIAVLPDGGALVYRELYQGKDLPGRQGLIISEAAKAILAAEEPDERVYLRLAPPDLWSRSRSTGRTQAEEFAQGGVLLTKADNARIDGWMALREWLKIYREPGTGRPTSRLKIFTTCPNLVRVMPLLQYDAKRPNDAAGAPHELTHAPDALRYWAVMRPFGVRTRREEPEIENGMPERRPARYAGGEVTHGYVYGGF